MFMLLMVVNVIFRIHFSSRAMFPITSRGCMIGCTKAVGAKLEFYADVDEFISVVCQLK